MAIFTSTCIYYVYTPSKMQSDLTFSFYVWRFRSLRKGTGELIVLVYTSARKRTIWL